MIKVTITSSDNSWSRSATIEAEGHANKELCARLTGFFDSFIDPDKIQVPGYTKVTTTLLTPHIVRTLEAYKERYKQIEIIEKSKND